MPTFKVAFHVTAKFEIAKIFDGIEIEAETESEACDRAEALADELEAASGTPAMQETELFGILTEQGIDVESIGEFIVDEESTELTELQCWSMNVEGSDKT